MNKNNAILEKEETVVLMKALSHYDYINAEKHPELYTKLQGVFKKECEGAN